jgi:hypothetical protein
MGKERKSYVTSRQPDGTYAIEVREGGVPAGTIPGFGTMNQALDECARLNAMEADRDLPREEPN